MSDVPELRVRKLNNNSAADNGQFALYGMTAFRRFLQKTLPGCLSDFPLADPLQAVELSRPEIVAGTTGNSCPAVDQSQRCSNR